MVDWSQIVQQHGPLVWTTVYRLLRHDADAADCFQRTFLSALVLSRTQTIRNWPGLLQRLGTARALEALRHRLRQAQRLRPLLAEVAVSSGTPEPDQAAAVSELGDHLREALAQLDARQAQVFCLICLDGLSYAETADQLGLTVSHVGVLLNRARLGLRERLQGHVPAEAPGPKRCSHDRAQQPATRRPARTSPGGAAHRTSASRAFRRARCVHDPGRP